MSTVCWKMGRAVFFGAAPPPPPRANSPRELYAVRDNAVQSRRELVLLPAAPPVTDVVPRVTRDAVTAEVLVHVFEPAAVFVDAMRPE